MDRTTDEVESICIDDLNHNLNPVAAYMANFFDAVEKHQGRMLKKDVCRVARMSCWKILREYNSLATRYNKVVTKYNLIVDEKFQPEFRRT